MNARALVAIAFLAAAAPVGAQSLFNTRGLGVPMDPVDVRARALGSIGTGLQGLNTSMVNPADLAGIRRRGVAAAMQPFFGSDELSGQSDDMQGTRFPLIQLMYPLRSRLVLGLGYGGYLEQSWSITTDTEQDIGGQPVATREFLSAIGALAQVRLSAAYEVSSTVAVGAALGLFTGNLRRGIVRSFPDSLTDFDDFEENARWNYDGFLGSLGIRMDPSPGTRVAASVTWSSDLTADQQIDPFLERKYAMPIRFAAGASALVAPRLLATVSGQYTGWDDTQDFSSPGSPLSTSVVGRPVWEVGGGLEWEELRKGTRIFPLRLGFRYGQLPFHVSTDQPANEWAVATGIGLRLASDDFGPLAVADISIERGRRSGWQGRVPDGLTENFWRFGASIALFGR